MNFLNNKSKFKSILFLSVITLIIISTACSSEETNSYEIDDLDIKTDLQIESWGAFEATHIDYESQTATRECPREEQGIKYIDPLPKLVDLAREHNIVMINEAHYKPIHRAFIGELAKALKEIDFNFYGAETFSTVEFSNQNRNVQLSSREYPVLEDGFYTQEPIFGQLIETLIRNDYTLFSYESKMPIPAGAVSQIAHRDSEQAKNILSELNNYPEKKVLIHAGYHHIRETKDKSGNKWMAQFLKEESKIDPLTISQTECYSETAYKSGVLGYAMPVNENGTPVSYDGYDVIIIPPKETQYKDRPTWLRETSGRIFIELPSHLKFDDQYTRITAYNLNKVKNAVIEDIIYRPPHSDKPLSLRSGRYRLEVTNKNKVILIQEELTVP